MGDILYLWGMFIVAGWIFLLIVGGSEWIADERASARVRKDRKKNRFS